MEDAGVDTRGRDDEKVCRLRHSSLATSHREHFSVPLGHRLVDGKGDEQLPDIVEPSTALLTHVVVCDEDACVQLSKAYDGDRGGGVEGAEILLRGEEQARIEEPRPGGAVQTGSSASRSSHSQSWSGSWRARRPRISAAGTSTRGPG